jgi:microcompartment protein CcmL/EutN
VDAIVTGPALAMLAIADVPTGLAALDALAKEAPVEVLAAGTIQSGEYLIAFAGEVEPVEMSFERALGVASGAVGDRVLLPYAEARLVPAFLEGVVRWPAPGDTLGVIQVASPPTLLRAVDAALKGAEIDLVELRLGDGLAGKGLATIWGGTHDVEAALALAEATLSRGRGEGASVRIIPNADGVVGRAVRGGTRFFKEWRG